MRAFGRRAILQGLAAAPVAGPAAVKAIAADVAASNMALAGAGVLGSGANQPPLASNAISPKTFSSFATWFKEFGEQNAKNQARYVDRLDPDLVEMRSLPLSTKFRMQRERNYKRIVEEQRRQFDEEFLRNGIFKWWP